jgi:hypothetical protein
VSDSVFWKNPPQPLSGPTFKTASGDYTDTVKAAFPFAAAFFFAAHRFFIAIDSAFRPASVRTRFLTGTGALAGIALGVAAGTAATGAGAGALAAAFAALIAAQRFFVAAMIARLPAALIFRFAGAVGPTLAGGFESDSTDGRTAFRRDPSFSLLLLGLEGLRLLPLACLAPPEAARGYDQLP